ncbi:MAG TPA: hypothetical protein PKX00_02310 [Opitutaceae bacterium]|jgi:hypothetical protein|nr:hypothetical protein [Opitutaceae bacterium]
MHLFPTPRTLTSEEDRIDIAALCRRLKDDTFSDWPESDESMQDDTVVPFHSLHDLVEASRGMPTQAPRRLWSADPFGGDAA